MPELPPVDDPEAAAFQRRYGPWQPWTPHEAAAVLADWTEPWWVAGGWAVGHGQLRPLDEKHPAMPDWANQVWLREHAWQPWVAELW